MSEVDFGGAMIRLTVAYGEMAPDHQRSTDSEIFRDIQRSCSGFFRHILAPLHSDSRRVMPRRISRSVSRIRSETWDWKDASPSASCTSEQDMAMFTEHIVPRPLGPSPLATNSGSNSTADVSALSVTGVLKSSGSSGSSSCSQQF